jgi:hypothetical protein
VAAVFRALCPFQHGDGASCQIGKEKKTQKQKSKLISADITQVTSDDEPRPLLAANRVEMSRKSLPSTDKHRKREKKREADEKEEAIRPPSSRV